jgi:DNA-binding IclR family transcriptional regulator
MSKPKSDYSIQTVSNALRLLESFEDSAELGVSELARRLELHKNNVFRLLATLESHGYIEQSSQGDRYRLGIGCLQVGRAFLRGQDLVQRARPVLEKLSAELEEASHLGVLRGFEVVHLDGQGTSRMLQSSLRIGRRLPAHCTALGKVLLGCGDEQTRVAYGQELARAEGLKAQAPETITDRDKLFEHLQSVGVRGYALDLEECEAGMCCAAVPVHDASGATVAAISISGPASRMSQDQLLGRTLETLSAAARELSRSLGYRA